MSRRTHLTEVGFIACDELSSLGAGEREGWLDDPALLAALHPHALALAHAARSFILLLPSSPSSPLPSPIKIRPSLSPDDGNISAVEWIGSGDLLALAVGTSTGSLLVYSPTADLIHKQLVYPGRILRLRFRGGVPPNSAPEELCVVMPGVIARFDGSNLKSLLERSSPNSYSDMMAMDEDSFTRIPFQIWSVNKYGPCTDAAIAGLMPPPLLELQLLLLLGSLVSLTTVQLLWEKMRWYRLIGSRRIRAGPWLERFCRRLCLWHSRPSRRFPE